MSALLMGQVWSHLFQSRAEMDIVLALADHGHDDGTHIHPSVLYLAWKAVLSERQVQRILRELEERGIIKPAANEQGGRGKTTEWEMHLENAPPKPPFQRGNPDCLIGVTYQKKGDISADEVISKSEKGDISTQERVTFSGVIQKKGDISSVKGDISAHKTGNDASTHEELCNPNHRTIIDQPSDHEPSSSQEKSADAPQEGEWHLPEHPLQADPADNGTLTGEETPPPVAPAPSPAAKGKRGRSKKPATEKPVIDPTTPKHKEDSDAMKLALYLRKRILDNYPNADVPKGGWDDKKVQAWATELDQMLRLDGQQGRDKVEAAHVIDAMATDTFWRGRCFNAKYFRSHYDTFNGIRLEKLTNIRQDGGKHGYTATRRSGIGQAPRGPNAYANDRNDIIPPCD